MAVTITQRRRTAGAARQKLRLVSFSIGRVDYGVDVADIHGIYHGLPIIPAADPTSFVDGEVQLAGQRVPVVNLRRFGGLAPVATVTNPGWIVIVNDVRGPVGLVVDMVSEVVRLSPADLEPAMVPEQEPLANYIVAVAAYRGRPLLLPDLGRLIHDATIQN